MKTMEEKTKVAYKNYLTQIRGFKILDEEFKTPYSFIDFVAKEPGCVHFIRADKPRTEKQGLKIEKYSAQLRKTWEQKAANWLAQHPECNCYGQVTFDSIALLIVNDGKGLVRYHGNIMNGGDED